MPAASVLVALVASASASPDGYASYGETSPKGIQLQGREGGLVSMWHNGCFEE
jgi:hypothetical protein